MGACFSCCSTDPCFNHWCVRQHDKRLAKEAETSFKNTEANADGDLAQCLTAIEKEPSSLVIFSLIENKEDESRSIRLLNKIFRRYPHLKQLRNMNDETMVFSACRKGRLRILNFLLDEGCCVKSCSPAGTAIHAAVMALHSGLLTVHEFSDLVDTFVGHGCDINATGSEQSGSCCPAVVLSTISGNLNATKILCEKGADLTICDFKGDTALHHAAAESTVEIVECLLATESRKTIVNKCNQLGVTPLHSVLTRYYHMVQGSPDRKPLESEEFYQAQCRTTAIIELLLKSGADTNVCTRGAGLSIHQELQFWDPTVQANITPLWLTLIGLDYELQELFRPDRWRAAPGSTTSMHILFPPEIEQLDDDKLAAVDNGLMVQIVAQLVDHGSVWPITPQEQTSRYGLVWKLQMIKSLKLLCETSDNIPREVTLQKMCRNVIRLHLAKCEKLHQVHKSTEIPSSLRDFITMRL